MPLWLSAGATVAGSAHVRRREPRQDALAVRHIAPGGIVLLVAADGAGSAPRGGAGAALACRVASKALALEFSRRERVDPSCEAVLKAATTRARAALESAANRHGLALRALATTLIIVVSDGTTSLAVHIGDGAATLRRAADGLWQTLSWPTHGEHAATTTFLTDDPPSALDVMRCEAPASAVAILTDGLERLVLDFDRKTPHQPFFQMLAKPLDDAVPNSEAGRHGELSRALGHYLASAPVLERTDDDKTLAIAVRHGACSGRVGAGG